MITTSLNPPNNAFCESCAPSAVLLRQRSARGVASGRPSLGGCETSRARCVGPGLLYPPTHPANHRQRASLFQFASQSSSGGAQPRNNSRGAAMGHFDYPHGPGSADGARDAAM